MKPEQPTKSKDTIQTSGLESSGSKLPMIFGLIVSLVIITVISVAAFSILSKSNSSESTASVGNSADLETDDSTGTFLEGEVPDNVPGSDLAADAPSTVGEVIEIQIEAFNFGYSKETFTASKGDTVRLTLKSTGGTHDLVIDDILGASTSIVSKGSTTTIEFTIPDDADSSYDFYCSVGNHRAQGMEGTMVVN